MGNNILLFANLTVIHIAASTVYNYPVMYDFTGGSVRFRAVSIVLSNDNRPKPDETGGRVWSRPKQHGKKNGHL